MVSYDAKTVKAKAEGKWEQIASTLAPDLKSALDANHTHVPCPIHGGTDGFRLFPHFGKTGQAICNTCGAFTNGFSLLMEVNGWDYPTTVNEIGSLIGAPAPDGRVYKSKRKLAPAVKRTVKKASKKREISPEDFNYWLNFHWARGVDVHHRHAEPLRRYWASRSLSKLLDGPCDDIRYIKRCRHPSGGFFGAKVLAIRDKHGKLVNLHRTFLTEEGHKAPVKKPRLMLQLPKGHTISGAAIRHGKPVQGVLNIAEGFENAAAVYCAVGLTCWSAVSANMLKAFQPPEDVHTVLIWSDKDKSLVGETAAHALKTRLREEGYNAFVLKPKSVVPDGQKGLDWNQVWQLQGSAGFPSGQHLWDYLNGHSSPFQEACAC